MFNNISFPTHKVFWGVLGERGAETLVFCTDSALKGNHSIRKFISKTILEQGAGLVSYMHSLYSLFFFFLTCPKLHSEFIFSFFYPQQLYNCPVSLVFRTLSPLSFYFFHVALSYPAVLARPITDSMCQSHFSVFCFPIQKIQKKRCYEDCFF